MGRKRIEIFVIDAYFGEQSSSDTTNPFQDNRYRKGDLCGICKVVPCSKTCLKRWIWVPASCSSMIWGRRFNLFISISLSVKLSGWCFRWSQYVKLCMLMYLKINKHSQLFYFGSIRHYFLVVPENSFFVIPFIRQFFK